MEYFFGRLLLHARSIWNHRWLAIAVAWLAGSAAFLIVATLPNEYQSADRIHVHGHVHAQRILKPLDHGIRTADPDIEATNAARRTALPARPQGRIGIGATKAQALPTISHRAPDRRQARQVVQSLLTLFLEGSSQGRRGGAEQANGLNDQQIACCEKRRRAAGQSLKHFRIVDPPGGPGRRWLYTPVMLARATLPGSVALHRPPRRSSRLRPPAAWRAGGGRLILLCRRGRGRRRSTLGVTS